MAVLLLLLWSSPVLAQSSNYTDIYAARLQQLSDRLEVLGNYVEQNRYVDVRTYIHGPLGEIRRDIAYLARGLGGEARQQAKTLGKAIADDLVKLDFAAKDFNAEQTAETYKQVKTDFNKLLQLLPN